MTSDKLTNGERLAIMEEQLKQNLKEHSEMRSENSKFQREVKNILNKMDSKLDNVIISKADKKELDAKVDKETFKALDNRFKSMNGYLIGAAGFIIMLLITIIGYLIRNGGV